jgi:hypothetical protein
MRIRQLPKALVLPVLLTIALPAFSQESKVRVKVVQEAEDKAGKGYGVARVVRGDAGSVVVLRTKGGNPVLGGLSQVQTDWSLWTYAAETMAPIKNDKPKIVWGEGPVALETIEHFNKQFRLIASKPDPERNVLLIIQQVLSPRSLTGKGAQLVTEIPYDRLGKGPEYFQANVHVGFSTLVNADSTKLLLQLTPATTTRSAGCPVFAMMLDKELKPLWNWTLQTDAAAREVRILDTQVDKAGAVWYLIKNVNDPAPKTKGELGYTLALYKLDSAGQQVVPIDLPGAEQAIDASFAFRSNGDLAVAGVYGSTELNRNESVGLYYTTLGAGDLKWGNWKMHELVKQEVVVKTRKEERWQTDIVLDRVLPRKDGGAFLVSHASGQVTVMVSDLSGAKRPKTSWETGDLHLMELTATGDVKWHRQVDRSMSLDNDTPGRLISTAYDDQLVIFMNDDLGNAEKRKAKEPVAQLTACKDAVLLEFKPDGTEKPRAVLTEAPGGCFRPSAVWRLGAGTIATLGAGSFGSDQAFPVLIHLSKDARK